MWGSIEPQRSATRVMQGAIAGLLGYGVVTGNVSVSVNAAMSLAITVLPAVLERDRRLHLDAKITLYITVVLFLHAVGIAGPYRTIWWWDHVTHTLAAMIVAGVGYATARAVDEHRDDLYFPREFMVVYILVLTLALGVFWEILEFGARIGADAVGAEPVLVQFSLEDTIVDLIFDLVGAVVVAFFGTREFRGLQTTLERRLASSRDDD